MNVDKFRAVLSDFFDKNLEFLIKKNLFYDFFENSFLAKNMFY